jgi:hypothetical protein
MLLAFISVTGSVGRAFRARGWEVFSANLDPGAEPTLVADVLDLQPGDLPPQVDCIYSRARTRAKTPRDLENSDALVRKVVSLIKHYGAPHWLMENPESGLMKTRKVVAGLPMPCLQVRQALSQEDRLLDKYRLGAQKTLCKNDCAASDGKKQTASADPRYSLNELYSIPAALCEKIAGCVWP